MLSAESLALTRCLTASVNLTPCDKNFPFMQLLFLSASFNFIYLHPTDRELNIVNQIFSQKQHPD